ncbi:unnamed protein product [Rangifer tarandus platyrhynchus]|uniref:Uncharacterized protein n=1 Tax=Rangifer tarandus platyrhynchus TaxID=3082113 RepID=A0ABN9A0K2_RANTA|nr:unnamed protein product [Rangifer tarandus platyrhynchus]
MAAACPPTPPNLHPPVSTPFFSAAFAQLPAKPGLLRPPRPEARVPQPAEVAAAEPAARRHGGGGQHTCPDCDVQSGCCGNPIPSFRQRD